MLGFIENLVLFRFAFSSKQTIIIVVSISYQFYHLLHGFQICGEAELIIYIKDSNNRRSYPSRATHAARS